MVQLVLVLLYQLHKKLEFHDQLIKYGETKRGWLGVRIQEVTKEIADVEKLKNTEGALVASVGEKSPAEKAGLKAGDIILKFDGKKIDTNLHIP